jgi:hypothetical protein
MLDPQFSAWWRPLFAQRDPPLLPSCPVQCLLAHQLSASLHSKLQLLCLSQQGKE